MYVQNLDTRQVQVKFLWGDGRLDYGAVSLNHVNLVQRTGRPHPADFIGGTYDFQTGAFTDTYGVGVHPDERELRFMLEQDLMQYEDHPKIVNFAATVEDTEPEFNLSFLEDPHDELYECAWENDKMKPKAKERIKAHVIDPIHKGGFQDAEDWIYFTVFGSGASFNWDEDGDFDVQMWVDIDKYNTAHDTPMTADDLVKEVRTIVQTVNFPSFADLDLQTPDCEGKMLIQFYPQPGTGSKDENLAKKPYACYDMETDEWLLHPKPYTSDFYGTHFLAIQSKANDIAVQAEALIDELQRNVLNFQFWSGLWNKYKTEDYQDAASKSQDAAELQKEGIATLFEGVFGGRVEAYSPEGEGIDDERDATQKLLEVWGIFQKLKHYARAPLPWDEQELPEEPKESMWVEVKVSLWKEAVHKLGDWNDLMDKARRLRNDQQVQITVNQPDHVVGTVQGDHGTYQTEIWRDDPQSQAITMWDCECPWSQYSWGRTRQWKKYEGRPCAHTLALFWQAQQTPPDGADQGAAQTAPAQVAPVPAPMGEMQQQQGLISPVPIPNQVLPLAPGQGIPPPGGPVPEGEPVGAPAGAGPAAYSVPTTPQNAQGVVKIPGALSHVAANNIVDLKPNDPFYNYQGNTFYFDPYFGNRKRSGLNFVLDGEVVGSVTWSVHSDHIYLESAYVDPGLRQSGIFGKLMETVRHRYPGLHITGGWNPTSPLNEFADSYNFKVGAAEPWENGQNVRNKYEVVGEDTTTNIKYTVPQNSAGTVLYSDSVETVVIFPLKGSYHSPHLVKVEGLTYEFYPDEKVNPFIRRRANSIDS